MTTLTETSVAGNDDRRDNENNNADQKLMIALDVDGTLVDHDGHMSAPVRDAAQAVVAAGHEVLIATGRSLNATLPIIEQIGLDRGYAVCCNGGVTLRLDPGLPNGYDIIHKATFDPGSGAPCPPQAPAGSEVCAGGRGRELPLHRALPGRELRCRGHRR
jgi:hypothetical protein